ncbi:non-ribosomal peptide synthetase, partial [Pseudomonas chlororaphis]|uniref:non-ribosomal peptide synthetase n=1 Tax=Pseudomonas chlororaphis TaxID=587753 RepID=UPI0004CF61F6
MQFSELMAIISTQPIRLQQEEGDLVVLGDDEGLDDALWDSLVKHKSRLLELVARHDGDWLSPAYRITPDMLPLVKLDQPAIERIVASVPGGAANVQDIYPLAPLQEGMLYHHLSARQGDPYVLHAQFAFASRERLQAFAEALQWVIERHDILRTAMFWERLDEPVQVVWRQARLDCEELSLDAAGGDVLAQLLARFDARHYRLDLRQAPLLRLVFAEDPSQQRVVGMLLFHHTVMDHTALDLVREEIQAHLLGQCQLVAPAVPFRDYLAQARLGADEQAHEAFFRQMLGDIDEPTLPFGLRDVQGDGRGIEELRIDLDHALSLRLRGQSRQLGVSAASLMHLALALVLGKASGRSAVVFGTVLLGRMDAGAGAERALGMFINTLPLRVDVDGQSVRAAVQVTHQRLTALLGHEQASLALAQRCSAVSAPTPLFSAMLNYRHSAAGDAAAVIDIAEGIQVLGAEERTNYPLTVNVDDLGEGLRLILMVAAEIGAARLGGYLQTALESLVAALEHSPDTPLQDLNILPAAERQQLLFGRSPVRQFADSALIHQQVEAQAAARPDATALIHEGRQLSYGELNRRANQLAHRLLALGVRPDDRVAICVERGLEMIVGLLGILKAGAGYVPIDPAYPQERIAYTLRDSEPLALLAQAGTRQRLGELAVPLLDLDDPELDRQPSDNPQVPGLSSANLAYVIYTSGSTGLPKGVMIEHRNVARLFAATQAWFAFDRQDVWALFHSFAFDFSVWEIWGALVHGGRLLVVPQRVSRSPDDCYALLCQASVSILNQTPSAFRQLIAAQERSPLKHSLRQVIFGGEALETAILKPWYARVENAGTQLVNMYGITETTVHVTYRALQAADAQRLGASPIGGAIPDLQLYVLDERREPVPLGVVGELYVGGAGVARGYLNREALTAERFIDDPFRVGSGQRLYKTGDLARWSAQGELEYLGRNDDQVKVRGFRIELGEIEARLAACAGVREAVVIAREDEPGDQRLVAYLIGAEGVELQAVALREQLLLSLADYMLPSAFVQLDALPLTTNGKLDRKALPAPDSTALAQRGFEAPQGEVEQRIAAIWQELLKVERVGRHDNFFELGGHSLLAVKLIERMRQLELGADVRVLFGQPTLAALAAAVDGQHSVAVPANRIGADCTHITPDLLPLADLDQAAIERIVAEIPGGVANVQDIYGLAPLQAGILYHHLASEEGDPYVLQVQCSFSELSRVEAFVRALDSLIARHDILRSSVHWQGLDEPVQVVWRQAPLRVEQVDGEIADGDVLRHLQQRFDPRHYRLDLNRAALMRFAYARDEHNQRWLGILLLHHILLDHTALAGLVAEMSASLAGRAEPLGEAVQYRNYVAQARLGVSEEAHEAFFREMLGDIDEPTLAFGLGDVNRDGSGVEEARLPLDAALARRLREQARQLGVSAASLVHLAWAQVLGQVSGREDVVFGTVLLGRMQGGEGADRALGMFINTLPLRVSLGAVGVRDALRATHGRLSQLLGHEHASLSLAQRCSRVPASLPLFSSLLNYRHSAAEAVATVDGAAWDGIQILSSQERSNYPLVLNVDDRGEAFELVVQTLAEVGGLRVAGYMQTALQALVEALEQAPARPLHELSILPAEERQRLLLTFNATRRDYPREQTLHALFEAQARLQPQATAAVQGGQSLSYDALNRRANQLAHHLIGLGVQPGDSVAILLERCLDLLASQLAVSKCAAVYVPLDINAPAERQAFMLEDSAARLLLSDSRQEAAHSIVRVELDRLTLDGLPEHNPALAQSAESVAYIMYTSGSTGTPKGVLVPHRAITRLVINNGYADFNRDDRVAFASNPAFDASTLEVWAPLLNGGCVVLVEQDVLLSRAAFGQLLQEQQVSVLWLTAGLFHQYADGLMAAFSRLRYLIVGGDVLDPAVIARVLQQGAPRHLLNGYGPTEATTFSTTFEITEVGEGAIPIGRPIGNSRAYVLDARQRPLPIGAVGELYIGGAGVAKGYLNQPELTAQAFIADPFSEQPQALLYRTGDLASWRADGTLLYRGRNDQQVKLRGFRIELGEIETRLAACPGVQDAVVLAREDEPGDKRLVAYFTTASDAPAPPLDGLRAQLQGQLPDYMVPSAYVRLDRLPLTANGKLDRKALPAPDREALLSRGFEAPQGAVEIALARIWSELLKVEQVGRHDHFFELGGHSLLAVSLIERMRQIGLSADVRALFSQPSLAALAAAVGSGREIQVPANRIGADCQRITPELLPLLELQQAEIDRIVAQVPGGVANVQDIYPLAPLQEGILYHHLSAGQGDPYLLQSRMAFDSLERLQAFAGALQQVIERHDILRTAVLWEGLKQPVQVVWRKAELPLQQVPLEAGGEVLEQLHACFDARHYRLDLTQAPLLRMVYAQDPARQRVVAILLFHHLALDHTAMAVVGEEMRAFMFGEAERLGMPVPYRNYVAQARLGAAEQEHEAFFCEMLGDIDEPTLPFGLQDVQGDGRDIEEAELALDAALSLRLRALARRLGVSAASLMHLAWAQVLGQLSNRRDLVFGTVLMGRMQGGEGADRALGMFINTLPLRVDRGLGVQAAVKATHARLTALLGHEHASLALAQRCSGVAAGAPLFSALLNYRHSAPQEMAQSGQGIWQGVELLGGEERSNYPLTLSVDDLGEGFGLNVLTLASIGAQRIGQYMHQALEQLAQALEQDPELPLQRLPILPQAEWQRLLSGFNASAANYPRGQTVHGLFEARAARTPDAFALLQGEQRLTYRQLNQHANQLAWHLLAQGVQPDDRVAICVRRGPQMLIGLLAILKAGAAYVPIDPAYPVERIAYLLQDSAPVAVLAQQQTRGLLGDSLPLIDLAATDWQYRPVTNPYPALTAAHLAYVIYTSGSTGLPKGVMVEHHSLENLVHWHCAAFDLKPGSHTSSVAGFGFDAMAWEVWPALCGGATLHLPPAEVGNEHIDELLHWWREQPLDVSFLPTPVAEYAFSQDLEHPTLRTLLIGGDRLRHFSRNQRFQVINNYGPTEATVVATSGRIEAGQPLHIGKPMANARIYLLDEQLQPVPVGVAGELYVGGAGVARGYLNRAQLTAERFLKDPFSADSLDGGPAARMYRTGDLARWLADGTLEYLGRNDDQVKIRGVRIELGEIETRLNQLPGIQDAVLLAREDEPGQTRLVAYFTEQEQVEPLAVAELRACLLAQLPDYMVPVAYVKLASLPLTANGKLDRKALPKPDMAAVFSRAYEAPQGELEQALAQIWADVLKLERVGRFDHFFELGGHSLLAMRMVSQVRQRLGVELALGELFANAELAAVARVLAEAGRSTLPEILPVPRDEPLPLSFAQQRLWFLAQMEGANATYNIALGLRLHGRLEVAALQRALARIVERHESLRSRFAVFDDEPRVLLAASEQAFSLGTEDLRQHPQAQQALQALSRREASEPFDLQQGPLLRGRLLVMADDEHVLLLTLHHIVTDGWSMGVLTRELMALYQAFSRGEQDPLPPLAVQYGDFAVWQRRWLGGERLQRQGAWWQQALGGAPALLMLPTDRPRPLQQDHAGQRLEVLLDPSLSAALKALSQRHGTTLYMTLMAAWAQLLGRLAGQAEVVIGTPVANRRCVEVEGLIGLFVNTLAVRIDTSGAPSTEALLARVKECTLQAQAHQDLPFEQVVELLRPVRSLSHSPLFQTLLSWENHDGPELALGDLHLQGLAPVSEVAKFDLSLSLGEVRGRISGSLEYATALFDETTMQRYLGYFIRLLQAMVGNDQAVLEQAVLLDDEERQRLLVAFNDTEVPYDLEQSIHGLFEAQVERTPEALAVKAGEQSLTYRALNERANQLAHYLREQGVGPDVRVAICVERGLEMVVGLLAILKAGGGYVPLDPAYPLERIAYMLEDSAPVVVLAQEATRGLLGEVSVIDLDRPVWRDQPLSNPVIAELTPRHLVYVIYTSGSTGKPKGVMNEHRAVVNRLLWMQDQYGLNSSDSVLQKTPFSFDVSVWEFFWPLMTGAKLVMARPEGHKDPAYLCEVIQAERITTLHFVPSMLDVFLAHGDTARCTGLLRVLCSGEALPGSLVRRFKAQLPGSELHNLYGPTEAAVDV